MDKLIIFPAPSGNGVAFAGKVPVRLEYPTATDSDIAAIRQCGPGILGNRLQRATYATAQEAIDSAIAFMPRADITVVEGCA